jgi:NAD(P)H dehydrogenase (quinone)
VTILAICHSLYGHIHPMAQAIAAAVHEGSGAEAILRRGPETLPPNVIQATQVEEPWKATPLVPVCSKGNMIGANAIPFGAPARFGNISGQMGLFLGIRRVVGAWHARGRGGKRVYRFQRPARRPGIHAPVVSYSMVLSRHDHGGLSVFFYGMERDGGGGEPPYGASSIVGAQNEHAPIENELAGACWEPSIAATLTRREKKV